MQARAIPALVAIFVCPYSPILADDGSDRGGSVKPAVAIAGAARYYGNEEAVEPWIHPKMAPSVRAKVEAGFVLATERVREVSTCRDMFARLGENGIDMLRTSLYLPVHSYRHEVVVCGRDPATNSRGSDILAYTKVGGAPTWICRNFARISTESAAIAIIHEALHHAGLGEWPHDRMAMSSVEITQMVRSECAF